MPQSPVPLFFTLAILMTVAAVVIIFIRTRFFGLRPNRWTYLGWALTAAVIAYFVVQGYRHA